MFIVFKKKNAAILLSIIVSALILLFSVPGIIGFHNNTVYTTTDNIEEPIAPDPSVSDTPLSSPDANKNYIKWVQFDANLNMMTKALDYDIKAHDTETKLDWVELLAYSVAKNWGNVDSKCLKNIDECAKKLKAGEKIENLTKDMKYYSYYLEAYRAILGGFVGEYEIEVPSKENKDVKVYTKKYGLKLFSPIAKGYSYSHYSDFGVSRTYGYTRKHLGNDLVGSVGAPIIAVEGGIIEAMGWNQYGGWRVGIRSQDGKRYYYYAHLRKNHPFNNSQKEGATVKAGDVIGYLGMTGYSSKENVNNITTPHLHFGMQLIFDESQKEGINQIWIDVYDIVNLLAKNKSAVIKDPQTNDFTRAYQIREANYSGSFN